MIREQCDSIAVLSVRLKTRYHVYSSPPLFTLARHSEATTAVYCLLHLVLFVPLEDLATLGSGYLISSLLHCSLITVYCSLIISPPSTFDLRLLTLVEVLQRFNKLPEILHRDIGLIRRVFIG